MIALAADCILLQRRNGESEPLHHGTIAIDVIADGETPFDEAFVKEASAAVLHYFKCEQGRESVTLGEFAEALEKVLHGFQLPPARDADANRVIATDLQKLAADAAGAFELTFFPRLREEVRWQLQQSPQVLRFRGLRDCVLRLAGSRRWTSRCKHLQEQIIQFLRECLSAEPHPKSCSLVVE